MRTLLYSIVSSVAIAGGNYFFDFLEFTVPLYAVYIKLISIAILSTYFRRYLFPKTNLSEVIVALIVSLLLSYLRIFVRNYKLKSNILDQKKDWVELQHITSIFNLLLLFFGVVALKVLKFQMHTSLLVYSLLVGGYTLSILVREQKLLKVEWSTWTPQKVQYVLHPIFLEFLTDVLTCYFVEEGSIFTLVLVELYEVYLLLKYHNYIKTNKIKEPEYNVFFAVLCVLKTVVMYLEYYSIINPVLVIFNLTGDLIVYRLISYYLQSP